LKFDLAAIPQDFPLVHAQLELTYAQAERNRAFGYVQVHGVESDWSAAELSYVDTPRIIHPNIAERRVDSNEDPLRFLAESPRMTEALATLHSEAHAELALQVESEAFGAAFYASEYHDPQTHPRLTLTLLQCEALPLTADANASVNNRQTDTPLGEGDGLLADRDRAEFYLRFDMSQIPLNARIVDARVELVAIDAVDYGGDASFTLDALTTEVWDESSVTYSTRPAATEVPLASFTLDTSEDRSPTEPVILETPELFHAVLEQFESERSISLRITANDDAATFAGRSHAEPNWRPRLTVIYE